jgi:ubiquinone/menaquinone biosynthesis C-methylase UbiE
MGALQAAAAAPGARVLDVGAGRGRYRDLFLHCEYKAQNFGQEPSSVGHDTALDYESHITAIPVPDASFDVVLGTEVLEHVPEPIPAVQEMSRILRPGGMLIVKALLGRALPRTLSPLWWLYAASASQVYQRSRV